MEGRNRVESPRRKTLFVLAIGIVAVLSVVAGVGVHLISSSSALSAGSTYYVSPSGNDSNSGSETQPFRTIGRAAALVQPGSTVYIKAGTYREQVTASASGAANNYITFRNYGSDLVVVDGECSRGHGFGITGSWITVQGLTVKRTVDASILLDGMEPPRPSKVTVTGMTLQDFDCQGAGDVWRAGVASWYGGSGITITNNTIQFRTSGSPYGTVDGIWFKSNDANPSGGGHYIAGNTIIGGWDGIGGEEEGSAHGTFDRDTIIENNTILDCWDDGIQSEGGDQNVRIRNNDISGCGTGIAFAAPVTGPLYVENNYIHDLETGDYDNLYCYKVGNSSSATVYLTGNTCDVDSAAEQAQGGADGIHQTNGGMFSIVSRDNLFHVSRYVFDIDEPQGSYDRDCIWTTNENFAKWDNDYYASLAQFRSATGQEVHGQQTTNCSSQGTPTPTPTPMPVGGIAELPDVSESAGRNWVAFAALALLALTAGAWHARTRWGR